MTSLKRSWVVLVVVGTMALGAQGVLAGSLWTSSTSMFADQKARRPGDLVTIIILERSQASQEAQTSTRQDASVNLGPGTGLLQTMIPLIGASGGDNANARGSTTRGGSIQARMTTRVVEILPSGNMRIEGRQMIVVNGEEQEILVSGVVRPRDIAPDNSVLSTYVADAVITFTGQGPLGDKQEPGILTKLFNWLF